MPHWIYILQSVSRRVLYIGVTRNLELRIYQHKHKLIEGFATENNCTRLIYVERYERAVDAIAREKQLKGWTRVKKERLIRTLNPHWIDLMENWSVVLQAGTKGGFDSGDSVSSAHHEGGL